MGRPPDRSCRLRAPWGHGRPGNLNPVQQFVGRLARIRLKKHAEELDEAQAELSQVPSSALKN
jgi:hypothetical protein